LTQSAYGGISKTSLSSKCVVSQKGTPSMALIKSHLISAIAEQNGFTKKKSTEADETILEIINSTLTSGKNILISGFGIFCVKEIRERRRRNPATGEDMILGSRRVVTFKCSGKLRDKIDG
jgi:integration host factor subunit alpha